MFELIYTASPKGLISGRSGFTTVAMTDGFPPNLISPIENLSGYKNLFPPESPDAAKNPANFIFQHYKSGATKYYVVSRITYAGLSYTGRCNNLAHHLIFTREELETIPGGAATILANHSNFPEYQAPPHLLPPRSKLHSFLSEKSSAWEKHCGHADWAKIIAERYRQDKTRCVILQFSPDSTTAEQILELVSEITALLTPEECADFTFSTYCYQSTIGNPIYFRAYPENSTFLSSIKRLNPNSVLVLGEDNPISSDDAALLERFNEREAMEKRKAQAAQEKDISQLPPPLPSEAKAKYSSLPVHEQAKAPEAKPPRRPAPLDIHPVPDLAGKMPWIMLSAVLIIVCIILAFLLIPASSDNTPAPPVVRQTPPEVTPAPSAVPSPPVSVQVTSNTPQESPSSEPSQPEKAEIPGPPVPQEEPAASPAPAPTALTVEQRFAFYETFKFEQAKQIPLPPLVSSGHVLDIDLSSIGSHTKLSKELLSHAIQKSDARCTLLPLKSQIAKGMFGDTLAVDTDSPSQAMTLQISDGQLVIQAPEAGVMAPNYSNIERLSIDGHVLYERKFSSDFVEILQNKSSFSTRLLISNDGQLILKYSVSENLLKYKNDVTLCFLLTNVNNQKTIQRKLTISNAEQEYKIDYSLKKSLDKRAALLAKCDSFDKDWQTFLDDLEKLKANVNYDFSSVHKMTSLSENEIKKILSADDDDGDAKAKKSNKRKKKKNAHKADAKKYCDETVQALDSAKKQATLLAEKFNELSVLLDEFKTSEDYSALHTATTRVLSSIEICTKEFSSAVEALENYEDFLQDESQFERSEQLGEKLETAFPQLKKLMANKLENKKYFITQACKNALEEADIVLKSDLRTFFGDKKYKTLIEAKFANPDAQERPISASELKSILADQFTVKLFLQGT